MVRKVTAFKLVEVSRNLTAQAASMTSACDDFTKAVCNADAN